MIIVDQFWSTRQWIRYVEQSSYVARTLSWYRGAA